LLRDRLRADRTQFSDQFDPDAVAHDYRGRDMVLEDAPARGARRARSTMKLLV
jgi:hypothetical protein